MGSRIRKSPLATGSDDVGKAGTTPKAALKKRSNARASVCEAEQVLSADPALVEYCPVWQARCQEGCAGWCSWLDAVEGVK